MIKLRKIILAAFSLGFILLIAGCNAEVLNPHGPVARDEKHLLITALLLMFIIVIPVLIATLVIAYRYRASNKKAKYTPEWSHSTKLEVIWWLVPIIIISILGTITWITTHQLDPYRPLNSTVKPVTIEVVSLEWRWLFIYPDQHIATINTLEFPVNTPINFLITSDAPMNSFQVQGLAGQIYAMAGMTTKLHLLADDVGDYNGRSVSFSGDGFANMMFTAHVVNQDEFNTWVAQVQKSPTSLDFNTYNRKLAPATLDTGIYYFTLGDDTLFNDIIMKYMHMGS